MSKRHAAKHQRSYRRHAAIAQERERLDTRQFPKGHNARMGERCLATTIREPDDPRWSPELPATYVTATCDEAKDHRGWHVSPDGYSWHPEDDTQYVQFPAPPT